MLQFSLKALLAAVLFVALACGVLFALPPGPGLFIACFASMALGGPLAAGVYYARGYSQAFAIGGSAGFAAWALAYLSEIAQYVRFGILMDWSSENMGRHLFELLAGAAVADEPLFGPHFFLCWLLVPTTGLLAMAVRWWTLRGSKTEG